MIGVNDIRSKFLDYFAENGHEVVASGPLVPLNDPTLMFTNAGMVQFKNVFTGLEKRSYSQAVTSQKCVRAGGKHNDLDNVGYTARHHTFFEMLGNFSFGDYFKERAIELAWNLITKEFGLAQEKLLATVYAEDDVAYDLWRKIAGFPDDRVIRIPTSDNFWSMGATGPCGPCSEIFYDHGEDIPGGPPGSPDEDGDRFVEIWNLVFMQFEQVSQEERIDLPKPSIDTGMGLERISAVLQGVHDNYDTDLFKTLIDAVVAATDSKPGPSHRIISDHLRATSFLIADGVLPSNEGRGYVLRRIMRRAMRHAHLLGAKDPLMHKLVPTLVREMGQAYPELTRAGTLIEETLKLEETRFRKTLARGLTLLDEATDGFKDSDVLDGETAFKLYDTYGFPLDLTQDALRSRGIDVDLSGFETAMEKQRAEARKAWVGSGDDSTDSIWFELKEKLGATEFLGYETEFAEGIVLGLVSDGSEVESLPTDGEGFAVFNQTPFYGESGGQVGDTGLVSIGSDSKVRVLDTQKRADGLFVHEIKVEKGTVKVGDAVELAVDCNRRSLIRTNHSATHLVHEALRQVLGTHVAQKGSLVTSERLRFDFSHQKPMSDSEIAEVERIANGIVLQNAQVETRLMAVDEAIESGAMALFGEKYSEEVRVVSMGTAVEGEKEGRAYSVELCGGTHVDRTGNIGVIHLVSESAVASGVRRLEALTGNVARMHLEAQDDRVREIAAVLKVSQNDVTERVGALFEERRKLEKDLADAKKKLALGSNASKSEDIVKDLAGIKVMSRVVEGIHPKELKSLVDEGKKNLGSGIVILATRTEDGKAGIVVGVTEDLTGKHSAIDLVRIGSAKVGGKGGGGRADMAQAGGTDGSSLQSAISEIEKAIGRGSAESVLDAE